MKHKERCSIALCPWRARYSFGIEGYYECWFHGDEMPLINWLWDFYMYLPHLFYIWMKYRVCFGIKGLRWKISLGYWLLPWWRGE
jgi:hypothetical protein